MSNFIFVESKRANAPKASPKDNVLSERRVANPLEPTPLHQWRLDTSGSIFARSPSGYNFSRMAEKVMRMPESAGALVNSHLSLVQRKPICPECEEEKEKEQIQTKPIANQITPLVQRLSLPEAGEEEEELVQTKALAEQITPLVQRQVEPEEGERGGSGEGGSPVSDDPRRPP